MNPRMAAIMGVFQIFWIYYGLVIASRAVIEWNRIAVLTNAFSALASISFGKKASKVRRSEGRSLPYGTAARAGAARKVRQSPAMPDWTPLEITGSESPFAALAKTCTLTAAAGRRGAGSTCLES